MDGKMFIILFVTLLLCCFGVDRVTCADVECNLKEHMKCSNLINKVVFSSACSQINSALGCMEDLERACAKQEDKSVPVCKDTEKYEYCSLLDGSLRAPMASTTNHRQLCDVYVRLRYCYTANCEAGGDKFIRNAERNPDGNRGDECPVLAIKSCVLPVAEVTDVNKDTCVNVAAARSCFLDKLMDCSGSGLQQHEVDVIIAGMVTHVAKCKEQDIGFSKDGSLCVPNPLEVFIPDDLKTAHAQEPTRDICMKIDKAGNTMEEYLSKCNTTDLNRSTVSEVLKESYGPRLRCSKAGLLDDGNGAGVRGHLSQVYSMAASLLVLVIYAFQ